MENKQTAVAWLQESMDSHLTHEQKMQFEGLFQQAIDMERQQIKDAHMNGFADAFGWPDKQDSTDYYNKNYGKN